MSCLCGLFSHVCDSEGLTPRWWEWCGSFGNLNDGYAWNPHCRYSDGNGPAGGVSSRELLFGDLEVMLLRRVWPSHIFVHISVNLRSESLILKVMLLMSYVKFNCFRFRSCESAICTYEMINTNIDTLLLAGATGGGANDWRGSWTHSTMDTSYGEFLKTLRISFRNFHWRSTSGKRVPFNCRLRVGK